MNLGLTTSPSFAQDAPDTLDTQNAEIIRESYSGQWLPTIGYRFGLAKTGEKLFGDSNYIIDASFGYSYFITDSFYVSAEVGCQYSTKYYGRGYDVSGHSLYFPLEAGFYFPLTGEIVLRPYAALDLTYALVSVMRDSEDNKYYADLSSVERWGHYGRIGVNIWVLDFSLAFSNGNAVPMYTLGFSIPIR